jgi:rod shape-determining protein MreB and related proteins
MSNSSNSSKTGRPAATEDQQTPSRKDTDAKNVLLLGFDWGTNTSCIQGALSGSTELTVNELVPTVVGYAKDGIVSDLLPGNATILYGQQALKHRLHLKLVAPMANGVLKDMGPARDFARYLRTLIPNAAALEIKAVVGVPANANNAARESIRQAVSGIFQRVLLIPEPFLAALGYRGESQLNTPGYVDPVRNSLFIDIGAGTTDVCLVQGYYPTSEDQISFAFAGDKVDELIADGIKKTYPDCDLSILKIRELKEKFSYTGHASQPVVVNVTVGGKPRKLDLTEHIGQACNALLAQIFDAVKALIPKASSDSVSELLQNIIITGGGSRIRGLDSELQRLLTEEGFDQPVVKSVGENYKQYVAKGALKAAQQAREDQWQQLFV